MYEDTNNDKNLVAAIPSDIDNIELDDSLRNYGIAALLAETLEAAVFADCSAALKACQLIEQYAYGDDVVYEASMHSEGEASPSMNPIGKVKSHELKMVNIDVTDAEGKVKTLSLPQITMMPLPLLHITEATFDMDFSMELVKRSMESKDETVAMGEEIQYDESPSMGALSSAANAYRRSSVISSSRPTARLSSSQRSRSQLDYRVDRRKQNVTRDLNEALRPRMSKSVGASMKVIENASSLSDDASIINMRIAIKMKQAELPEGIKAILQTAFSSLSINENKTAE